MTTIRPAFRVLALVLFTAAAVPSLRAQAARPDLALKIVGTATPAELRNATEGAFKAYLAAETQMPLCLSHAKEKLANLECVDLVDAASNKLADANRFYFDALLKRTQQDLDRIATADADRLDSAADRARARDRIEAEMAAQVSNHTMLASEAAAALRDGVSSAVVSAASEFSESDYANLMASYKRQLDTLAASDAPLGAARDALYFEKKMLSKDLLMWQAAKEEAEDMRYLHRSVYASFRQLIELRYVRDSKVDFPAAAPIPQIPPDLQILPGKVGCCK